MNGIKFKGYKAFSDDWISIENFPNITVEWHDCCLSLIYYLE